MSRQHLVTLSPDQRTELHAVLNRSGCSHLTRVHCRTLLLADTGHAGYLTDAQIGARVGCCARSVARTRVAFATKGLDVAIQRKARSDQPRRRLSETEEAKVVALALEPAPDGRARWTVRTLTSAIIAQGIVPQISRETIRLTLKKTLHALDNPDLVYCAAAGCQLCRRDGNGARCLCPALRSAPSGDLFR